MPLVLMQCSGLGNALNALGSLAIPYGLGFPLVLSMRGTLGERNPSQMPLGRTTVDAARRARHPGLLAAPSPPSAPALVADGRRSTSPTARRAVARDHPRARAGGATMNATDSRPRRARRRARRPRRGLARHRHLGAARRDGRRPAPLPRRLDGHARSPPPSASPTAVRSGDVVALLGDGEAADGRRLALVARRPAPAEPARRHARRRALHDHRRPAARRPAGVRRRGARARPARRRRRHAGGIAAAARELSWPALLEVRYADRSWPGPSPFVDPPLVRSRFEAEARSARRRPAGRSTMIGE